MCYLDYLIPKITVPEGVKGDVVIGRFSVDDQMSDMSRIIDGSRYVKPGDYTRLEIGDAVVMSDTQAERRDHIDPVREARGRCLVAGLGLGVVVQAMLLKWEVDHVTIVEKNQDVIDLVAPHYYEMFCKDKIEIIHANIFKWRPPRDVKYDVAWFDIWPTIATDNLVEMQKLDRKFKRKAKWRGSWCRDLAEQMKVVSERLERMVHEKSIKDRHGVCAEGEAVE